MEEQISVIAFDGSRVWFTKEEYDRLVPAAPSKDKTISEILKEAFSGEKK